MSGLLVPQERTGLLELLRPPDGFSITDAVSTTYTLDLLAMLSVPVAMTFPGWQDEERDDVTPLAVLEALRRQAGRITVFCQAGGIKLPTRNKLLMSFLEESVFDVAPKSRFGVFHPKVWVLRFAGPDDCVSYRLLCLTRNMTFDQSWDTVLALDGELTDRKRPYAKNHGISDLIGALPGLVVGRPVPAERVTALRRVQRELRLVDFEVPEGFDDYITWSTGTSRRRTWPFASWSDRMLVVSPFLSDSTLRRLADCVAESNSILVSRTDSIDGLAVETRQALRSVYVLNPAAQVDEREDDEQGEDDSAHGGLHAKLYLLERGRHATLWTGSANATDAAYRHNVEFLVGLFGWRGRVGIDVLLARSKGQASLRGLLSDYEPPGSVEPSDEVQAHLDRTAGEAAAALIASRPECRVAPGIDSCYDMRLKCTRDRWRPSGAVRAICWPISLQEQAAAVYDHAGTASFERVTLVALTSFFAFEVAVSGGARKSRPFRFVLNLPLIGAPEDRADAVLRSLLSSPGHVYRLMLLLLADSDAQGLTREPGWSAEQRGGAGGGAWDTDQALLESLVRALARNPERLKGVARLVADLRRTAEGAKLLPPDFDRVWDAVWEAYRSYGR